MIHASDREGIIDVDRPAQAPAHLDLGCTETQMRWELCASRRADEEIRSLTLASQRHPLPALARHISIRRSTNQRPG